jgi:CHAT domain-containing protein/lipopolysaccharide biosynthesis regulator YciM
MTLVPSKSLSLVVRGGVGILLGALLLTTPPRGESHPAPYSSFDAAIIQDSGRGAEALELGKPLERKLAGGESHLYEIQMSSEQFLRLEVEQRGIDVALTLFGPDGKRISDIDNIQTERGSEALLLIAKDRGGYRLEVRSNRRTDPLARYEVRIEGLHAANEQDRAVNNAARLIAEANKLLAQQTAESLPAAIAKYQEAIPLLEVANDLRMKALALNKIGTCYYLRTENQKAIEYHSQALLLAGAADDRQAEALILMNLGQTSRAVGEHQKGLGYLNRSLEIWHLIEDRRGEMEATIRIGSIYSQTGELHKALSYYNEALQLSHDLGDQRQQARLAGAIGLAYYAFGDNYKALEIYQQGLVLARANRYQGMEASLLGQIGAAYNLVGENQKALEYLNQALQLARSLGERQREASTLQTMGRVYRSMGEPQKSIDFLQQSLVILKDVNSPTAVARAHYNLGKVYTDLGQYEKALDHLNQALPPWKAVGDQINIAVTIRELARAELGRGNLDAAMAQSEAALNLMERLRTQAGGEELRASYLASVQNCFELRVDVLTRLHKLDPSSNYAAAALQTSERARARSLLDTLAEADVDIRRGVAPDLLKRERTITEELSAKASDQARLLSMKSGEGLLIQVGKEIRELSDQYERLEAQIRAASPLYAELIQPQPLSVAEIREQVIDNQTLLLEYYLGAERSYLWAVTSNSIESYELPKREVIETAARHVYELLTARNRRVKFETVEERRARIAKSDAEYPDAASALSHIVLGPVAGQLLNRRLLIVSDGALQYVPFAALPTPNPNGASYEPLTVTHEVVSLPSASTLAVLRRQVAKHKPAPKTIAVLADPVFDKDDKRVKNSLAQSKSVQSGATIAQARRAVSISRSEIERSASESGWDGAALSMVRLPFTRREADAITALVPAESRKEDLDFAASLANATSAELSQYRIVHFATHGFLNSQHPELSGIVLSLVDGNGQEQNGFLRAHEIYNLTLPAELVVLSGCRTGLGKEIRGEGLIGLTRAFMHAGAARVLVSLWDVHDEATAELMTRFYASLLGRDKLSPAAALRAAQVSMARDKRWSSPYFWASFTLQGEPR